jgi:hypothetical protein
MLSGKLSWSHYYIPDKEQLVNEVKALLESEQEPEITEGTDNG